MSKSRLKRIKNKNRFFQFSLLAGGVFALIFVIGIILRIIGFYNSIQTNAQTGTNKKEQKEKNEYNILLLGYGGGSHEGTYLTDTIMVVHVDLKSKKAILISIPRDIWVKVPTKSKEPFHNKINAVYQMGLFPKNYPDVDTSLISKENGSGLIKTVIEDMTGLEIDAFAAVDFEGFIKAVDTLGGITVDVERSFTDYEYPIEGKEDDLCEQDEQFKQLEPYLELNINADELENTENDTDEMKKKKEELKKMFDEHPEWKEFYINLQENPVLAFPCRYEELYFEAGEQQMDGETALKFARSRHSLQDGGDFNRAKRQQLVLEAVKSKVLSIGFIPKIIPLLDELEGHIITDLPLGDMNKLLLEARKADEYQASTLVLTLDNFLTSDFSEVGQYIIIPKEGIDDWSAVKKEIQNIKNGVTPSPTRGPTIKP